MSEYKDAAEIAEQQLNNISSTMCYAKWSQVSMHLTNGMTHSCYHPPTHQIDVDEIKKNPKALHNTQQKKKERAQMLAGERPEGCSYCWKIEDVGGRSDRIYRSGEYWAQNSRKDIIASTVKQQADINPRYVEVNFNQACNFKCIYCSPHLSNTWEDEIKEHGPVQLVDASGNSFGHNDTEYLARDGLMPMKVSQKNNPYLQAFWEWWPEMYETLEVFRMTGGEPLMDSNTYKVLDYIYENPNAWLELSITSNLCPPKEELWDKFMNKMKKLEEMQIWESSRWNPGSGNNWYVNMATKNNALFVSVDSVGEQAEYIRTGLDYQVMQKHVDEFLSNTCNSTITFINTFNLLSVPKIREYMEYILELRKRYDREGQGVKKIPIYDPYNTHPDFEVWPRQRVWFDIPLLRYPDWLSIDLLPASYDKYLEDTIEFMEANYDTDDSFGGFYDFEVDKLKRNLEWMRENRKNITDKKTRTKNLQMFLKQMDNRRGTNFNKVFPEFGNLI
jgi:organic radical activating enzyme